MQIEQPAGRRKSLCLAGGSAEPVVPVSALTKAISPEAVEHFRPLLPVGYEVVADAYRRATIGLTADVLSAHYKDGLDEFHDQFVPELKSTLSELSGGAWNFDDYLAFAAGSDVDLMTHIVEAAAAREGVSLFPGDWYGFRVGCSQQAGIRWRTQSAGTLACLCLPSVRNGHLTTEMVDFLQEAETCLLNINLYPTLSAEERSAAARSLLPVMDKSILSISFSRGFGMTASQLGVILVHRDHPWVARYSEAWNWFTYFYNQIAVRTFRQLDLGAIAAVDERRREEVKTWLTDHDLPALQTGSYYVKSFRPDGELPAYLSPLARDGLIRLCFKPKLTK